MTISPVQRTPTEIWRLILRHAIASPLLPYVDEGVLSTHLVETLHLFTASCRHCFIYRNVTQATIERLRLVCRTWADLLRSNTNDFVITDLDSHHYTSEKANKIARRVNIWTGRVCGRIEYLTNKACPFRHKSWNLDWKLEMDEEQYLNKLIPNVSILILDPLLAPSLRFLTPLSNLVALSLNCAPLLEGSWSMGHLVTCIPRLTHLCLKYLSENSRRLSEEVTHFNLLYLRLAFDHYPRISSPQKFMDWIFPSLQTLIIRGLLDPVCDDFINNFITRHARNIIGLDIDYRFYDRSGSYTPAHIPSTLWEICPNINAFGIDSYYLSKNIGIMKKERNADRCPPIQLLIHEFKSSSIHSSELAMVLQDLVGMWKVSNIVIAGPWSTVNNFKPRASDILTEFNSI
jgi:hypothetical protein